MSPSTFSPCDEKQYNYLLDTFTSVLPLNIVYDVHDKIFAVHIVGCTQRIFIHIGLFFLIFISCLIKKRKKTHCHNTTGRKWILYISFRITCTSTYIYYIIMTFNRYNQRKTHHFTGIRVNVNCQKTCVCLAN